MYRKFSDEGTWGKTLKAYVILTDSAIHRQTITYGVLGEHIGEKIARNVGRPHLNRIAAYCRRQGLPKLHSLVVLQDTGEPNPDGYGSLENLYRDREEVYAFEDWFDVIPPTIEELKGDA